MAGMLEEELSDRFKLSLMGAGGRRVGGWMEGGRTGGWMGGLSVPPVTS